MPRVLEREVQVFQDDDELLTFKLHKKVNGNWEPYDLTSATIEFIVKEEAASATAFDYTSTDEEITITSPETSGVFSVQFARADLATAGTYRYAIRVTQSGKRRTVAYGPLIVEDV